MRTRQSPWPLQDERLHSEQIGYWHAVDIAEDEATQWGQLGGSARRNVRHAREAGVVVTISAERAQLREFYELHRQLRKYKYGLLAQPWAFFENALDAFGPEKHLHVLLARVDGRAVGGILALIWGETLYYKYNASALNELDVRPNDLLAWEAIGLARREGLRRLDFGFSDADQPGLVRYKRKFATDESLVYRLQRGSTPAPASALTFSRNLGELTRLLTDERMPDHIAESASTLLYQYFA
jgi:lipid II:glycine glycyltransferase (peptidoglycan interpeptide bridge formation enzyme)